MTEGEPMMTDEHARRLQLRTDAQWFAVRDENRAEVLRAARLALFATGAAQAVHHHDAGADCVQGACFVMRWAP